MPLYNAAVRGIARLFPTQIEIGIEALDSIPQHILDGRIPSAVKQRRIVIRGGGRRITASAAT